MYLDTVRLFYGSEKTKRLPSSPSRKRGMRMEERGMWDEEKERRDEGRGKRKGDER